MRRTLAVTVILLLAVGLGACASLRSSEKGTASADRPAASSEATTLYKRLGGREGIRAVVDDFVALLVADPRVNARFKDLKPAELERLKTNAADKVCEVTGGPCAYLGRGVQPVHAGMKISEAEWTASLEDLGKALDKRQVAQADQQELLNLIARMKPDVVGQ